MELIEITDISRQQNRRYTPRGEPRGYIETQRLRELWFNTGTACNLACPFCLEGSKPGDDRLQLMTLADVKPFIDEALQLGVENFSFTGGEPFVARDMHNILAYAAQHRPCLVLTNGTAPLRQRLDQIAPLIEAAQPIRFRISIDYPEPERHEAGRGPGTFNEALASMKALYDLGFKVSLARQWEPEEDTPAVEASFRKHLREYGLPEDLALVSFPDFAPPNSQVQTPEITEHCMTTYHSVQSRADFMCAFSRMVVKKDGQSRVYACTLVDDDSDYDLGGSLRESLAAQVMLSHHRCYSCFKYGASCSEE
ncbi:radical SAM protein [Parahaliea sp. F7430]|uniref:Radical SAM protein n=1 Tax=Sediminihaliea albiluteola TaxID=2758564 RepID=A0A7W2TTM4_9GAMM|nr:radical SAM protein [Sediminihaliea albiluteola]MBA6411716.1 radical SAM protein [Sediminihaliea albiluteola]